MLSLIFCFTPYRNGCGFRGCDDKNDGGNTDCIDNNGDISQEDTCGSSDTSTSGIAEDLATNNGSTTVKPPKLQKGVLRTNCIDCLDRTNVAQYAYGLASLGHQLHALGSVESPELDLDSPLAHHLMHFYERMGDTLALQYGGSAAHNKVHLQWNLVVSVISLVVCCFCVRDKLQFLHSRQ